MRQTIGKLIASVLSAVNMNAGLNKSRGHWIAAAMAETLPVADNNGAGGSRLIDIKR